MLGGCNVSEQHEPADVLFTHAKVYTMNATRPTASAVGVLKGKIIFVGSDTEAKKYIGDNTKVIDLKQNTMTPGFIESHGHFMGMGYSEMDLNLMKTRSYDDLLEMVKEAVSRAKPGEWILGRGWHQSKWDPQPAIMIKGFQTNERLNAISPDNPVYLTHASGHAAFANDVAIKLAGVNQLSVEQIQKDTQGGEIIRDKLGNPTGIFTETTQKLIASKIPDRTEAQKDRAMELAIENCQKNGITSFVDAGAPRETLARYQKFKDEGKLGVRMYVMLTGRDPSLLEEWYKKGSMIDSVDHFYTIRSIKLNCDGALGSRGAWLLEDYTDRPGHRGAATISMDFVKDVAEKGLLHGFQVCSHAIGDRTNREVLDRYEWAFNQHPVLAKDSRYRIEHAQHLNPVDIPRFARLGVIASMQAIHLSSDRPWAIDRLGKKRIEEGAYMWQSLLKSGAKVINGTDVPVEPIDPIACFFASVTRQTLQGTPPGGYEPKEKMTREQALRSYTLDAAYGEFEENYKGSIEVGKAADFTVFSQDIMTVPDNKILNTRIVKTILGGNIVYDSSDQ